MGFLVLMTVRQAGGSLFAEAFEQYGSKVGKDNCWWSRVKFNTTNSTEARPWGIAF